MRNHLLGLLLFAVPTIVVAQEPQPHKYALLAAVKEYQHPEINEPKLAFPEEDAKSFRDLLKESGYEVDILLGKQATQASIQKKLRQLSEKGGNKGVVMVGLFGHGIEFQATKKSYFFPYDTPLKAVRDADGRVLLRDDGQPRMEPDPNKMISIDDVLIALKESLATNRVLVADCCRDDPNAARGRSFGTSLEINQLPKNTAVFFACSENEKAYEHRDWGHGAFTKCLLDSLKENAAHGKSLMGSIAESVAPAVEALVATKVTESQTPRLLSTGAVINLQLASSLQSKPETSSTIKTPGTEVTKTSRVDDGINLFKLLNDRFPKDHDEFIEQVIKTFGIKMPSPPPGKKYQYDAEKHKLVLIDAESDQK